MPQFGPDQARAFSTTFADERGEAAARAAARPWPTVEEEIWRYSRIGELNLDEFTPTPLSTDVVAPGDVLVQPDTFASLFDDSPDQFSDLNAAFGEPTVIRVKPGQTVADTIVITHTVDGDGAAVFPRTIVDAGTDCEVTIVERFASDESTVALVCPVLQIRTGAAARVRYVALNDLGEKVWLIGHQRGEGDRDSSTTLGTVALGGYYARVHSTARLVGRGGSTRQLALYFAGGDQMHDFRTTQDHDAPDTTSDLLFKGAVADRSRSVYTGLIRVRKHARGTNAFQTNRNLTLGDEAWAESVPNLDIQTNEVKCSHASTVGPIDDEQRFYLESRGIPTQLAERLIVLGYFDEVFEQLPIGPLAGAFRAKVATKLARVRELAGATP